MIIHSTFIQECKLFEFLQVVLLGQRAYACLLLNLPLTITKLPLWNCLFHHPFTRSRYFHTFKYFIGGKQYLIVSICLSYFMGEVEDYSVCLLAIGMPFSLNSLFIYFTCFSAGLSLSLIPKTHFHIKKTSPLSQILKRLFSSLSFVFWLCLWDIFK